MGPKILSKFLVRKPSSQTLNVLEALHREPQKWQYGFGLAEKLAVSLDTVYRIIDSLDDEGLVDQERKEEGTGGPARHLVRLNEHGRRIVGLALEKYAHPATSTSSTKQEELVLA